MRNARASIERLLPPAAAWSGPSGVFNSRQQGSLLGRVLGSFKSASSSAERQLDEAGELGGRALGGRCGATREAAALQLPPLCKAGASTRP